jgi:hypothetical protein
MRKIIGGFILLFSLNTFAQNKSVLKKPAVDQRIEMLSIVFRLADSREYSSHKFPEYVDKIEAHFDKYKDHELIRFIKKLRKKRGVAYDAVMSMAIHISQPPELTPLIPFSNEAPDSRWGRKNATKFLELLNDFYTDADCESFFLSNRELYKTSSDRFLKVYNELDVNWYLNFYGQKPKGEFVIVLGLGNGGGNYGPKIIYPDGRESVYAIMGTWSVDSMGLPEYKTANYFPTLLHEFNHSFINHLVVKNKTELKNSGQEIYRQVKDVMRSQAYGNWKTMISEALVRAAVVKYMKDHHFEEEAITKELNVQLDRGFLWTGDLVEELERYDSQREKYPSLESFMPEIVKFFNATASNMEELIIKTDEKRPNVVSIEPFENGRQNVDYNIKKIIIHFDRALKGKGYSIANGRKGDKAFPEMGEITYSEDKKSVIIEVELKPDKNYQFVLMGWSFKSPDGFGIKDYEVNFKTKK